MEEMKEKGTGIYKNNNSQGGIFAGSFPLKLLEDWERDCVDNFNGCRWVKMYTDHCKARQLETEDLMELVPEEDEEEKEEKPKDEVKVLGEGRK